MSITANRDEIVASVDELIVSVEASGELSEADLTSTFEVFRATRRLGDDELTAQVRPVAEAIMLDEDPETAFANWRAR